MKLSKYLANYIEYEQDYNSDLSMQECIEQGIDAYNSAETVQYYVSVCPDTGRQFLVQFDKDGNIIELTPDSVEQIRGLVKDTEE